MQLDLVRNVVFVGEIPREELRRFYRLCDVFVLPSLFEAQPMALLEAMAAGRPVVASAIDPVVELLPPGMHLIARPTDTSRFAELVIEVLHDSSKAAEVGARLKEHAYQSHRWPSVIGDLEGIYARALGRNKVA
jgi:glycosyltransferase involved in cell wall biosynthesis